MNEHQYDVKILVAFSGSDVEPLIDELHSALVNANVSVDIDKRYMQAKSFEPINIFFTAVITKVLERYIINPSLDKMGKLIADWKKAFANKRHPLRPVHIRINLIEQQLEIITVPYLLNQEYIENFLERANEIFFLLHQSNLLANTSQVRLISETVDEIRAICYQNNGKPTHSIDLSTKQIVPLNNAQIDQYTDPSDEHERLFQWTVLQAKLYRQMIDKHTNQK